MLVTRSFSAISSLFGSFLLMLLICDIFVREKNYIQTRTWLLAASALVVFNIIYLLRAQNGTPYAVAACMVAILIATLWKFLSAKNDSQKIWFIALVLFSVLGAWFNYQIIIFSAVLLPVASIILIKETPFRRDNFLLNLLIVIIGGVSVVLNSILLWRTYISGFVNANMNQPKWKLPNMGFPNFEGLSLFDKALATPEYFIKSWWENVSFNLVPVTYLGPFKTISIVFGSIYFLLWIIGLLAPISKRKFRSTNERLFFGIFTFIVFCYTCLNIGKIIPVGASRHGHHLTPMITLQVLLGARFLFDALHAMSGKVFRQSQRLLQILLIAHVIVFLTLFSRFYSDTRENYPMDKITYEMLTDKNLVGIVGFGGSLQGSAVMGIPKVAEEWAKPGKWAVKDVTWGGFEKVSEPFKAMAPGQRALVFGTIEMGNPVPYFEARLAKAGLNASVIILSKVEPTGSDEAFHVHADNGYWLVELVKK